MLNKKIFRFTLALLLVVVAAGAAWMAGSRSGLARVQPTAAVEAQSNIVQGRFAWDCPGCPPPP